MDKTKKKNFRMPSGIRNKLMGAVAMLLVSSIMVVSSTYAWFTLSTAPEVTGITTSVGANGNLEMALLNTTTFANLSAITSSVGDSVKVQANATDANITWGNLVDLSDRSYGLDKINLLPSRLSILDGKTSNTSPLKTPVYGADGRVASVDGRTYTTVYNNGWGYDSARPTYGVRGIGANDNLTPQQAGLIAAKAEYNAKLNSAKAAIQSALSTHGSELASAITTLAMNSEGVDLTTEQQKAIAAMVTASETALGFIDAAYKQVLVAAASAITDSNAYNTAVSNINGAADFSAALSALTAAGGTVPPALTSAATALSTQKSAVTAAKTATTVVPETKPTISNDDYKTALSKLVDTQKITVNGYEVANNNENPDDNLMGTDGNINSTFFTKVVNDGGVIVEMPDGSGVFAYVGKVAGNYSASCVVSIDYKGLTLNNMGATMKTTATLDTNVTNALNSINAASTSTGATALSDLYGYALDFAFRTNASGSKLQLQTGAAQRVYTDSENAATQGSGSNMTFTSALSEAGAAVLTDTQVQKLMEAIRVAFINPDTGAIYGIAGLANFAVTGDGVKGDLVLMDWTVNAKGVLELSAKASGNAANDDIMELQQNTATKLTVIVWLDGDKVDNGMVANAAKSLSGSMNLQFSSSATLIPMQNSALKGPTANQPSQPSQPAPQPTESSAPSEP